MHGRLAAIATVMACTSNHTNTVDADGTAQGQTYDVLVTDQDTACVGLGFSSFAQTIVINGSTITVADQYSSLLGPVAATDVMVAGSSLTFTVTWSTDSGTADEDYTLALISGDLVGTMTGHYVVGAAQCRSTFSVGSTLGTARVAWFG